MTTFTETEERLALRKAVGELGRKYGRDYFLSAAKEGRKTTELWQEAGKLGYLGVAVPEEYGGGGGDIGDLAAVCEELAAAGSPLLLHGRLAGDRRHDHRPVRHRRAEEALAARHRRRNHDDRVLHHRVRRRLELAPDHHDRVPRRTTGAGGSRAARRSSPASTRSRHVLVVARTEDAKTGNLKPALFIVPTDAEGFTYQQIDMGIVSPEKQFTLFFDDVRLPADALVGSEDAGIEQLFAGLNPERIMGAAFACGTARLALEKAVEYAKDRQVWKAPIGSHQAIAHPLAADLHRDRDGPADDAEGRGALRRRRPHGRGRGGQHGEVRGRRGRRATPSTGPSRPTAATAWPTSTVSCRCWPARGCRASPR